MSIVCVASPKLPLFSGGSTARPDELWKGTASHGPGGTEPPNKIVPPDGEPNGQTWMSTALNGPAHRKLARKHGRSALPCCHMKHVARGTADTKPKTDEGDIYTVIVAAALCAV